MSSKIGNRSNSSQIFIFVYLLGIFVAVAEFAKKTGDFAVLSRTDLLVLALTYELTVEVEGFFMSAVTVYLCSVVLWLNLNKSADRIEL